MTDLSTYIRRYCPLGNEDLDRVAALFTPRAVAKNRYILKRGQVCGEFVFVVSGLFRQYYKDAKGREITTWISFEGTQATELSSFVSQQPARFFVQALENSEVMAIPFAALQELYAAIPAFQEFGRKITEKVLTGAINRIVDFQMESAEERYRQLLERPEFIQRVPLKYLASFIGVTETSLSRLRRRTWS